jgi:hypothetical protein
MVRLTFLLIPRLPFPNSPPLIGAAGVSGKHGFPNVPVSGVSGTGGNETGTRTAGAGLGNRTRSAR